MSDHHEAPEQRSPQDAQVRPAPSTSPLATPPLATPPPATPPPTTPSPAPAYPGPLHPSRREVMHLPAGAGPNWGLVLSGLAFMVIAAGVILNQVNGFELQELQQTGPMLLVAVGVGVALIGIVGLVTRRGR